MLPMPVVPSAVAEPRDAVAALARGIGMAATPTGDSVALSPDFTPPRSAEERAAWLVGLRQIVDAAEATFTAVLADFDAAGDGEVLHAAASTQAWLRGALGMAAGDAAERVRIARASRDLLRSPVRCLVPEAPQPVGANTDPFLQDPKTNPEPRAGEGSDERLSFEKVKVIARTIRGLPPSSHHDAVTALTRIGAQVGVDGLRATARHLKQVIDPDGSLRQAETDFQRRWLTVAPMLDGMHSVEGVLDSESAALLNSALAPFAVPTGGDDRRTAAQRRADGLAEIVTTAMKSGSLPSLSGPATSLQVQVSLAALLASGGYGRDPGDDNPVGNEPVDDTTANRAGNDGTRSQQLHHQPEPAQLVSPTSSAPVWIPGLTLGRITCDATVRRIVLDPAGVPIELGRQVRLFTGPQREALARRDARCRFPGCDRPSRYTDAHHLVPWTSGGPTTLSNGLLLCRYHHRQVHEGGWRIRPTDPDLGANCSLNFFGPDGQRLTSAIPESGASGPTPTHAALRRPWNTESAAPREGPSP